MLPRFTHPLVILHSPASGNARKGYTIGGDVYEREQRLINAQAKNAQAKNTINMISFCVPS